MYLLYYVYLTFGVGVVKEEGPTKICDGRGERWMGWREGTNGLDTVLILSLLPLFLPQWLWLRARFPCPVPIFFPVCLVPSCPRSRSCPAPKTCLSSGFMASEVSGNNISFFFFGFPIRVLIFSCQVFPIRLHSLLCPPCFFE